ncbi:MAG: PHP domain-containing protein [Armatimonadetes bacterium]|nr:PHP domain-containing protein [Armatimonadota bacterium]
MRLDLHLHTCYSYDSLTPPEEVVRRARLAGLDAIAVTDHNSIDGAFHAAECSDFPVILGEEVASGEGDIIGLFLKEWIPPSLGALETVGRIKEQGGVVYIPHPLCRGVPSKVGRQTLAEILPEVDVIEGINARVPFPSDNLAAQRLAVDHSLAVGAGSDGHFGFEVGRAGVEMEQFSGAEEFKAALKEAKLFGTQTPLYHSAKTFVLMCFRRPVMRWVGPRPYRRPRE